MKSISIDTNKLNEYKASSPYERYAKIIFDNKEIPSSKISMALFRYEPGQIGPKHVHEKVTEIYFILQGEGILIIEGKKEKLFPGKLVYIPPGNIHETKITRDADMVFLSIFSPAFSFENIYTNWEKNK